MCGDKKCARRRGRCKSRLCTQCNNFHTARSVCLCEVCNRKHAAQDCELYAKVQRVLKDINDDCIDMKEAKQRLKPISAQEKGNAVNEFIREVYNSGNCKNKVCGVCGLLFCLEDINELSLLNRSLLKVTLWEKEKEGGRLLASRTRVKVVLNGKQEYLILKKEGIVKDKCSVKICKLCMSHISKENIPPKSYVAIDPGPRPKLPTLTIAETVLLSMYRVTAIVYRVARGGNSVEERQRCYRGHMVSFARPDVSWMFTRDCDYRPTLMNGIDIIGDTVRVVCMSCVNTPEEAVNLIKLAKDLEVRKEVLRLWMKAIAAYRMDASLEFHDRYMESKIDDNANHVDGIPKVRDWKQ
jgi:hypothetical protein